MSNKTETTATNKYGEQGWGDEKIGGKEKVEFMRLAPGSNKIRVLTKPFKYFQHTFEPKGGKQYGYKFTCSDPTNHKNCPLCELGNKTNRKWLIGIVDRKSGAWKVFDLPYTVFRGMQLLAEDEGWGGPECDLTSFDIDIINNPSAGAQRYSVVPRQKTPLSAADLQIQEEHGTKVLVQRSTPPEREVVQGYYDSIVEELRSNGVDVGGSSSTSSSNQAATEDDDNSFFTDYDKKSK